jgi:hypothetical protein
LRIAREESPDDRARFWRTDAGAPVADHRVVTVRPADARRDDAGTTTTARPRATDVPIPGPETDVTVTVVPTEDNPFHRLEAAVEQALADWSDTDAWPVVCGGSVGNLLAMAETDDAIRSLERLLDRLREAGALVHFHGDPATIDPVDRRQLDRVFDRVIEAPHADPASGASTTDLTFELLRDECRREAVRVLGAADEPMNVDELARRVARPRGGSEPDAPSATSPRRTTVDLYHNHLPKLADAGYVAYDRDAGTVEPTASLPSLRRLLDQLPVGTGARAVPIRGRSAI